MGEKNKPEYVYHGRRFWVQSPKPGQHVGWNTDFEPCVIFKKTTKRIGILSPTLGVLYLNREVFERDGKVYHSKPHEYFYKVKPKVDPEKTRFTVLKSKILEAFEVLGLSFPASEKEVRRAYKRKAREVHPDKGGTNESFVYLKNAFDIAIANV